MRSNQFSLCQGDAVAWLRTLRTESIDLVITDPAYESLEKHRSHGTTTRLTKDWFDIFPNARFPELFQQLYRVLKRDSHLYIFCDAETAFAIKPMGEDAGFKFWKPLVWDKRKIGMGYHYRGRYEFILFFEKGKRRLHDLAQADVIECDRIHNGYPTEKPVPVSSVLVLQSSVQHDVVCDPFMGSGSVGEAALRVGRDFIGNDLSAKSLELARPRLDWSGEHRELTPEQLEPPAQPPKQGSLFQEAS